MKRYKQIMARRKFRKLRTMDRIFGILVCVAVILYDVINEYTTLTRICAVIIVVCLEILEK